MRSPRVRLGDVADKRVATFTADAPEHRPRRVNMKGPRRDPGRKTDLGPRSPVAQRIPRHDRRPQAAEASRADHLAFAQTRYSACETGPLFQRRRIIMMCTGRSWRGNAGRRLVVDVEATAAPGQDWCHDLSPFPEVKSSSAPAPFITRMRPITMCDRTRPRAVVAADRRADPSCGRRAQASTPYHPFFEAFRAERSGAMRRGLAGRPRHGRVKEVATISAARALRPTCSTG